jgi:UDP-2,3-diacylglucosamine pyrophosphatase LpxH
LRIADWGLWSKSRAFTSPLVNPHRNPQSAIEAIMPTTTDRDLIILSDLHLSAGYDPRLGTFDRNEDFFYDKAFARFLAHLQRRATAEGRRWRLVLLGDIFDFLQVDLRRTDQAHDPLDRSEAITIAKLERIAQGHRPFFTALGEFAAAGNPIAMLPGNHDIELIRPATQARFAALVAEAVGRPEVAAAFTFHPWVYYEPGLVYAEHGHQYDATNSFITQLEPYVTPGQPDRIDLPLGSYFVEYLFNRIEAIDPFADNIKPATAYLAWALRAHPVRALATLGAHAGLFMEVLRNTEDLTPNDLADRRQRYRQTTLHDHAPTTGLTARALTAIDELAAVPAMTSKWRQLRALLVRPVTQGAPALALATLTTLAILQAQRSRRPLGLLGAAAVGTLWQRRGRRGGPVIRPGGYLRTAAEQIDAILRAEGRNVPFYLFGHTHSPEQFPLDDTPRPPRYINSGTWTPIVSTDFELLSEREQFTFVQILRDPHGDPPTANLRFWDDTAGRDELLPLLAV